MPVTATHIVTLHDGVARTSYTTASITPSANQLVLAFIFNRAATGSVNTVPTLSGNGLTWVEIANVQSSFAGQTASLFRALGSPSAGVVTIDFNAVSQDRCGWSINEFNNVDRTGTNGSGAVVQSVTGLNEADNSGITLTLAAFSSVNNATYGGVRSGLTATPGTGFTELGEDVNGVEETEWRNDNDTSVDWTWTNNTGDALAIAIEIKFVPPGAGGGFYLS